MPTQPNDEWAMDFMHDSLEDGQGVRTLNVIDEFNREALAIEVGASLSAAQVVRVLDRLCEFRGVPNAIRVDNGPEFVSKTLAKWADARNVTLNFIEPGKPQQNAFVKRFNRTYREDVLDMYLFRNLGELRKQTARFITTYNTQRPHQALNNMTPAEARLAA